MKTQALLFLFESAPYDGEKMREGLEALFAARIFDIPCTAVLIQDGVYACQEGAPEASIKNIHKMLSALPMYDIDQLLIHQVSAEQRQLKQVPLNSNGSGAETKFISNAELAILFKQHPHSLSFWNDAAYTESNPHTLYRLANMQNVTG